jgi:hypothetical protein
MSEEEKASAPEPDAPAAATGDEDHAPEEENQAHFEPVVSSLEDVILLVSKFSSYVARRRILYGETSNNAR